MKSISTALAQHLAGEVTTLATCWQITRRDDVVLGFADHVRDLVVDGVTYRAASGYTRTAIRGTADLAVDKPRRRELSATAFEPRSPRRPGGTTAASPPGPTAPMPARPWRCAAGTQAGRATSHVATS
jgi:hypothetical protein